MTRAMQFPVSLIEDRARKMRTDITIGNQSMTWQVNQNTLRILIGVVKDFPLILG